MYNPMAQLRCYDLRRGQVLANAALFMSDLRLGRYAGLSLRAVRPRVGSFCGVAGHLQPPEFAFDPNVGSLLIRALPKAVSVWEIIEVIQDCSGFCTASWSWKNSERRIHARFSTCREARAAADELIAGAASQRLLREKDGQITGVAELCRPEQTEALIVLPPEMSTPERVQKDQALSAE
ncbi:unnamed protein product, partial [Durusdinium trenchii]